MSAALAEVLGPARTVHLFDSFQGLPPAKPIDGKEALAWQSKGSSPLYFDNCRAEEVFALEAMKLAGHKKFQTHPGWFEDTVPKFGNHPIGILRLDGDWYDSIMVCLDALFPRVTGGESSCWMIITAGMAVPGQCMIIFPKPNRQAVSTNGAIRLLTSSRKAEYALPPKNKAKTK